MTGIAIILQPQAKKNYTFLFSSKAFTKYPKGLLTYTIDPGSWGRKLSII